MAKKLNPESEKAIQKEILAWLSAAGIFHWRQNSGMAFVAKRMIRLGAEGLPDIFVIRDGLFYGIEVKSKTGKLRPAQERFKESFQLNGFPSCRYHVVRSVNDVKAVLGMIP